jgi:hypothetical protein
VSNLRLCPIVFFDLKGLWSSNRARNFQTSPEYYIMSEECAFCFTREGPLKRCSRCKVAQYCSVEHQRAHWPKHKAACMTSLHYTQTKVVKAARGKNAPLVRRLMVTHPGLCKGRALASTLLRASLEGGSASCVRAVLELCEESKWVRDASVILPPQKKAFGQLQTPSVSKIPAVVYAAGAGDVPSLLVLLEHGAKADVKTPRLEEGRVGGGRTALMQCCQLGLLDCARVLVAHRGGCAINALSAEGSSALLMAFSSIRKAYGSLNYGDRPGGGSYDPLEAYQVIQLLLEAGADVNAGVYVYPEGEDAPVLGENPEWDQAVRLQVTPLYWALLTFRTQFADIFYVAPFLLFCFNVDVTVTCAPTEEYRVGHQAFPRACRSYDSIMDYVDGFRAEVCASLVCVEPALPVVCGYLGLDLAPHKVHKALDGSKNRSLAAKSASAAMLWARKWCKKEGRRCHADLERHM